MIDKILLDLVKKDVKGDNVAIFMGGGTPSLFSPDTLNYLLVELAKRLKFSDVIEITLEANPGTVEYQWFYAYREAGINRLSLGIQSFSTEKLKIDLSFEVIK